MCGVPLERIYYTGPKVVQTAAEPALTLVWRSGESPVLSKIPEHLSL